MFQSKIITKDFIPDLPKIITEVKANPNRHFTVDANSFTFLGTDIKELLKNKCRVLIKKSDGFSKNQIQEFIAEGKALVILQPIDFEEATFLNYLEEGASTIVSTAGGFSGFDTFDLFDITKIAEKGGKRTTVVGSKNDLEEKNIKDYLDLGSCVVLKKLDLTPSAISRLLPFGKERIHINAAGFRNKRIDEFLEGEAKITFGKGNQFSETRIKKKVTSHASQIFIEFDHFKSNLDWIKEMEDMGANII